MTDTTTMRAHATAMAAALADMRRLLAVLLDHCPPTTADRANGFDIRRPNTDTSTRHKA